MSGTLRGIQVIQVAKEKKEREKRENILKLLKCFVQLQNSSNTGERALE
jgi:hypothetical protein